MPCRNLLLAVLAASAHAKFPLTVPGLGDLKGKSAYLIDHSVAMFLGIPYAKPPVDDLRWRAPQPHGPWDSPRDATSYRDSCVGSGDDGSSEDCLFLNIATPAKTVGDAAAQHPVMIWIHGGTYDTGGAKEFTPENVVYYAGRPVVVATINYRINLFGFLGSQSLEERSSADGTGNYGIQDQRLAITWIRDRVSVFGGNGAHMTLFGESAGGNSVLQHLVQPASAGLFQKVIVQSGTYDAGYGMADAQPIFDGISKQLGCADVACLVQKTATELTEAKDTWVSTATLPELHWGPVVDGVSNTGTPQDLIAKGEFSTGIPVLIGSNLDEFSIFITSMNLTGYKDDMNEADLDKLIGYLGPDNVKKVKELYDPSVYEYPVKRGVFSKWWWMAMRVATDNGIPFAGFAKGVALGHCSMRRVAEHLVHGGAPALYMYNFARSLLNAPTGSLCGHGMDVPFTFGMSVVDLVPGNRALSKAMILYFASFAAEGAPSGDGLQQWPAYAPDGDMVDLRLDATAFSANISMEKMYRKQACDFWDHLSAQEIMLV